MNQKAIAMIVAALFSIAANATPDYRQEIHRYVITPCHTKELRQGGEIKESEMEAAIELINVLMAKEIEDVMSATIPVVTGRPFDERMQVYSFSLGFCLRSSSGQQ